MTDTAVQDDHADDAVSVIEIRPGMVLTDSEWAVVVSEAAAAYGLASDQVLCTPYGYAPMPRPPQPAPDGRGKVWPGARFEVAMHPVFWLPNRVRGRQPSEDDDLYAVRIHLELVNRGLIDPSTQAVINPFHADDIDTSHAEFVRDFKDYLAGQKISWLCQYVLPDDPTTTADEIARMALRLVEQHRQHYYRLRQKAQVKADKVFKDAVDTLRAATFKTEAGDLMAAGEQMRTSPNDFAGRNALTAAVEALLARMDHLDNCRETMIRAIEQSVQGTEVTPLSTVHTRLDNASTARRDQTERRLAAVIGEPSADTLRGLWQTLQGLYSQLATNGASLADDAVAMRRS